MEKIKLLVTDMDEKEWNRIKKDYEGWTVIRDDGSIHPCIGCFSCWKRTPGECCIKDGYDQMGLLISRADEIVYNSRFTYGGFSSFVKNVFDRSLGYVLPYFEVSENEMHHKKRYAETKRITFIFRGEDLTDEEKAMATRYVQAVCRNLRGEVKEVVFEQESKPEGEWENTVNPVQGKTVLLNCSIRGINANSEKFLTALGKNLEKPFDYLRLAEFSIRMDELIERLLSADTLVLAMPLYVDGLPSNVIRLLERLQKASPGLNLNLYVRANLCLYESHQLNNLLAMIRYWCDISGYRYCGGLAVSAGELIGVLIKKMRSGPVRPLTEALKNMGKAVDEGEMFENRYVQPAMFPRALYIAVANLSWDLNSLKAGMKPKDLYRRL